MICTHFLLAIKMGYAYKPSMKLYWTKDEHYCFPFYSQNLTILKYLHFADTQNPPTQDREDPDYYRLWKL
jgi:hypothetical protein